MGSLKNKKSIESRLPEIVKISYVDCDALSPMLMLNSICNMPVTINAPLMSVALYGSAALTWSTNRQNGAYTEKSTLTFNSPDELPLFDHIAFVVETAHGKTYLIGAKEPRYPIIKFEETTGEVGGKAAVRTYTVTHVAQKSVLPCVV